MRFVFGSPRRRPLGIAPILFRDRSTWYDVASGEFGWRPSHPTGGMRDTTWEFDEPDTYPALVARRTPGLLASAAEKAMHAAIASGDPDRIITVAGQHPTHRLVGETVAGLLLLEPALPRGIELLTSAIGADQDVRTHRFVRTYLQDAGLTVAIAPAIVAHLPLMRMSLGLLVAELHQLRHRHDEAVALLQSLEQTTWVRVSHAEIAFEAGEYPAVVDLTEGVVNDDDVTALLLTYRGRALAETGHYDEAMTAFARALDYDGRAAEIKAMAHVGRGLVLLAQDADEQGIQELTLALVEQPNEPTALELLNQIRGQPGA
jgi:tetratricopeptide (TPR) repeat protein